MSDWHSELTSPNGQAFRPAGLPPLTSQEAGELVGEGALIVVDPCGDGCADVDWLDAKDRQAVLKRGMLLKRKDQGTFYRWESDSGAIAVFLDGGELRA